MLVRTDLISPDVLTGDTRPVVFANGITMNLPVVECVIDTWSSILRYGRSFELTESHI